MRKYLVVQNAIKDLGKDFFAKKVTKDSE